MCTIWLIINRDDENYDFEFEDDDDDMVEPYVDVENCYYNSKCKLGDLNYN